MPKFKVLSPINHNNKAYAPGKLIELEDDEAAPLLNVAVIEATGKAKAETAELPAA